MLDRFRTAIDSGHPVRYTAAGDSVFALVRHPDTTVTLGDIGATPMTVVETLDGTPLAWKNTPSGVEIEMRAGPTGPEPVVIVLRRVERRPPVKSAL